MPKIRMKTILAVLFIFCLTLGIGTAYAANLSDGRGAYASSDNWSSPGYPPSNAFDEDNGTWCAMINSNPYLQVDLGANYYITGYDFYNGNTNESPDVFYLQGSTDGINFYNIHYGVYHNTNTYDVTFAADGPYRYIRFLVTSKDYYASINEFNIYGYAIPTYTVSFNSNGGSAVGSQTVSENATASTPTSPTKPNCNFAGWYTDNSTFNNPFNFSTAITSNRTLYAKWVDDSLIAQYEFNGSLSDEVGGSVLTAFSSSNDGNNHNNATSSFGTDSGINGDTTFWQWTSTLARGGGFWIDTNSDISTNYSIGVRFAYDSTGPSYKKIIDYQNMASDNGFYFYSGGKLNYFPNTALGLSTIANNQIVDIIATRASDGTFTAYTVVNGTPYKELEINDSAGDAIPVKVSGKPRFGFFYDDTHTASEATSGGKVYSVKIWNRPIAQAEIATAMNSSVAYNANGGTNGSVPIDANNYAQGDTVTVLGNTGNLARTGYSFVCWNTQANGSGINYSASDTFVMGANNAVLYAKWVAVTPPNWISTYPKKDTMGSTTGQILVKTDKAGKAYYVVLPDGAPAPSAAEVKAGTGQAGLTPVTSGSVTLAANTQSTITLTGLSSNTVYNVYLVAQDNASPTPNLQASPVEINVATDIIAYYKFNGNALDSSGNGNNATASGSITYGSGFSGQAASFNGSTGNVVLPYDLIHANPNFTIIMRFKTTGYGGLLGYQNASIGGTPSAFVPILSVRTDGKLYSELWVGATQPQGGHSLAVTSTQAVNDGNWHKVALSATNTTIALYLDDVLIGNNAGASTLNYFTMSYNQLGTNDSAGRDYQANGWFPYTGSIDDCYITKKGMSSSEIQKLTNSLTLGSSTIPEAAANDGSIVATQVVTLNNATFAADMSSGITVNNLPAGLGISVTRNSNTQITISFTGNALQHTTANNVSNASVAIAQSKIIGAAGDVISGNFSFTFSNPVLVPAISVGSTTISEAAANNGSIVATQTVTLVNGTFAADMSSGVTVNNLPTGLGISVTRNSNTQITITFTGSASRHGSMDSVANASVKIASAKITGATSNITSNTFAINFKNPAVITVQSPCVDERQTDYTSGIIDDVQIVKLTNGTFDDSVTTSGVTVNGLPGGLGISVTKDSSTQITIAFTGTAANNANANDVNNASIAIAQAQIIGAVGALTTNSFKINFDDPEPVISVGTPVINESDSNDGSISESQTFDILYGSFDTSIGVGNIVPSGLPSGLSVDSVVCANDGTSITITFGGNATSNSVSDNVQAVTFAISQSKIVPTGSVVLSSPVSTNSFAIDFIDPYPSISVGSSSINEGVANDGSIIDTQTVILSHGTFVGTNGQTMTGVTVNNIPAGLTATAVKNSDTQATISFTGRADSNRSLDNILDASITIAQANIAGAAADVTSDNFSFNFDDLLAPSIQASAGNLHATVTWNTIAGATGYKVYKTTQSGTYGTNLAAVNSSELSYDATGLTNGTKYYFVVKANNSAEQSAASNEVSVVPIATPAGLIANAQNGAVQLSWTPSVWSGTVQYDVYKALTDSFTITDYLTTVTDSIYTVSGLTNGTKYYFAIKVKNENALSDFSASVNETPFSSGNSPGTAIPGSKEANGDGTNNSNGNVAGVPTQSNDNGKIVTTIPVDDGKLNQILNNPSDSESGSGSKPVVTIPISGPSDVVVGELNGQTVKNMETKEAVLEIKTQNVTYTLPAEQINIDNVSNQIGSQIELKDIKVSITITEPTADTVKVVEDTANKNNYQVVVKPVEFEITCNSGTKTIEVSKFNGYVERTVAIPEGVDPSKITTGVILNTDGTFSHVPTKVIIVDDKYYAKINSLTNSTYSVIYNPKEFKDVAKHWSKKYVNEMGSRLVIKGIDQESFAPNRDVTRAEFAAIVIRALGLRESGSQNTFSDVKKGDWYYGAVGTAVDYRIIAGYENGTFKPEANISRQEAMAMISRAMKLAKMNVKISEGETKKQLSRFNDGQNVEKWARNVVAACIRSGVSEGRGGDVSPLKNITRAETAALIMKMLQKASLI